MAYAASFLNKRCSVRPYFSQPFELAMTPYEKIAIVLLATALLSGCGKEGPFGNTPGPKKPEWMKSKSEAPEETEAKPAKN